MTLSLGLLRRVEAYLGEFLSQKSRAKEAFPDVSFSRSSSSGSIGTDEGLFEQREPLASNNAGMEKLLWRRSLQLRDKQQAWQVHLNFKYVVPIPCFFIYYCLEADNSTIFYFRLTRSRYYVYILCMCNFFSYWFCRNLVKAEKLWNFVEVSLLIKRRMLCWQQFHRIRLAYFVISFKFLFFIYLFFPISLCQKIQDILSHSIVVICLCFWGL